MARVSSPVKDRQRVLCIRQVTRVVFPQASPRLTMLPAADGGITQASRKQAGRQCDSWSNYGIIQCKLLGDNNNKSGLARGFENLGLTDLPVTLLVLQVCKTCNGSQAWQLDLKDTNLLSLFTLNC